uniref:Uncharacterized protein n=1 Tax=Peromyscus maniculatus bairdii TaxID=230844 RepID=A0A8C8UDP6_PERMB
MKDLYLCGKFRNKILLILDELFIMLVFELEALKMAGDICDISPFTMWVLRIKPRLSGLVSGYLPSPRLTYS